MFCFQKNFEEDFFYVSLWFKTFFFRFKGLALQCIKSLKDNDTVEEFFVSVAEAYDVLTNDKLKAVYDQYGSVGLKSGVPTPDGFVPPYVYHGDCLRTYE